MNWLNLLQEQVDRAGSIQAVADELDYSRTSVSLALKGHYPGKTDKLRAKVISTYCDRLLCPHTGCDLAQDTCADLRTRPLPQSDPDELRHWLACQCCANNPDATTIQLGASQC